MLLVHVEFPELEVTDEGQAGLDVRPREHSDYIEQELSHDVVLGNGYRVIDNLDIDHGLFEEIQDDIDALYYNDIHEYLRVIHEVLLLANLEVVIAHEATCINEIQVILYSRCIFFNMIELKW